MWIKFANRPINMNHVSVIDLEIMHENESYKHRVSMWANGDKHAEHFNEESQAKNRYAEIMQFLDIKESQYAPKYT